MIKSDAIDFMIIGGQKCGSTFLHHVLDEHPQIGIIKGESPQFESPDYENGDWIKLIDDCKKMKVNYQSVIGIKRPNYLCNCDIPSRVNKHVSRPKFIIILRDRVERLVSAYYHYMGQGFLPHRNINKGIECLLNGNYAQRYLRSPELLNFGLYGKYMEHWLNYFDRRQFLILRYDELTTDKIGLIRKCYEFLEVDTDFIPKKSLQKRPQKVEYDPTRLRIKALKNSLQYEYNSDKTRLFVKEQNTIDKIACKAIDLLLTFYDKLGVYEKDDLTQRSINLINEYYQHDVTLFNNVIGNNFD
ncbi:MAG: sulfotransferase [Cytophagales bacterium]